MGHVQLSTDTCSHPSLLVAISQCHLSAIMSHTHTNGETVVLNGHVPQHSSPLSKKLANLELKANRDIDGEDSASSGSLSPTPSQDDKTEALQTLTGCYQQMLSGIGEDTSRQGLLKTTQRAAKALLYFTKGYNTKIEGMFVDRNHL